jgi:hypothetical protein
MKIALIAALILVTLLPRSVRIRSKHQGYPKQFSVESQANPLQSAVLRWLRVDQADLGFNIELAGDHRLRIDEKLTPPHRSLFSVSLFGAR